jgi:hypothetical protein
MVKFLHLTLIFQYRRHIFYPVADLIPSRPPRVAGATLAVARLRNSFELGSSAHMAEPRVI